MIFNFWIFIVPPTPQGNKFPARLLLVLGLSHWLLPHSELLLKLFFNISFCFRVTISKMSKISAVANHRLRSDYLRMKTDPIPYINAEPLPSNILEWHYVVQGPKDSPYYDGFYHGKLIFPMEYPFKPPSILMTTPSGRFKTDTRLCLSMSDFHPGRWNPAWSPATILTGLLSFMLEEAPTTGSIVASVEERKEMAIKSWQFNLDNKIFCELFPETVKIIKEKQQKRLNELAMQ
ncbi:ubiquitin-conjugating enzyme E2 J2 [Hyalella azteca]|uniref:Ubiquitin-conjugating enzyme E2 J2 n=1 Tax=Hyalella azteca TaxID=294128 RepID=A0A8B7NST5_HYAAZ|nr:ubiquitin-conjugating enzyme E2 J2 [Hyalella azteca]